MSPERFNLLVDAFDLAAGDLVGGVGDNALKMLVQQLAEPKQMRVGCGLADVHDINHLLRHTRLVRVGIRLVQLLLDEIKREKQLVLPQERIVLLFIPDLTDNIRGVEEDTPVMDDTGFRGVTVFLLQRGTLGHENIPGLLQPLCCLNIALCIQAALLVLADRADHLVVEVLDQVEVVEDRLDMRAEFFKRFLKV